MPFSDRALHCRDCGKAFIWTAGEQAFFASKGFSHPPSRCKEHRLKHKAQIAGVRGEIQRKEYVITCSNCGRQGKVPFEPSTKQALLCTDCFMNQRAAKAGAGVSDDHSNEVRYVNRVAVRAVVVQKTKTKRSAKRASSLDIVS